MTPAMFLDRDGVIIEEVQYLADTGRMRLIPGAAPAIARLNRLGIPTIVVTNQAGVARGLFPESRVTEVHKHLTKTLARFGASIDRYYYCPHHLTAGIGAYRVECACRKPKPGMLKQAAAELGIDLARSFLVGDKLSDLLAGAAAGCQTILVRTGYGAALADSGLEPEPLHLRAIAADLAEAVDYWLQSEAAAPAALARRRVS